MPDPTEFADDALNRWMVLLGEVFALYGTQLPQTAIDQWLVTGNPEALLQAIDRMQIPLNTFESLLADTARRVGDAELSVRFDLVDQNVVVWAQTHSAELVGQISAETRLAVRSLVSSAVEGNFTAAELSRALRRVVGLTAVHSGAVQRQLLASLDAGVSPALARRTADAYARRLLRWRTDTIARTETMLAANRGQLEAWRAMRDNGLFSSTSRRVWLTAKDDLVCPLCAPMNGVTVGFEDPFVATVEASSFTVSGGVIRVNETVPLREPVVLQTPPRHPRCRCTVILKPA